MLQRRKSVIILATQRSRTKAYGLHQIIKIVFGTKNAPGPACDIIAIRNQAGTLCGAAFKDIEDVPDVVKGEFRLAYSHTEPEQRRLDVGAFRLELWLGPCTRRNNRDHCKHKMKD